jgi:hypothetical protein
LKPPAAAGSLAHFHRDVMACTRVLNRTIPALVRTYTAAVVAVALVLQLEAVMSASIGARQMNRKEAKALMQRLEQMVLA